MPGIDSILRVGLGLDVPTALRQKGLVHAHRSHSFRAGPRPDPPPRVRAVCCALPRPAPAPNVLLLRPTPLSGLRPVDVPRESPRHRDLLAGPPAEAVSRRAPRPRGAEHPRRCERDARLADLRRLCATLDPSGTRAVRRRALRGRVGADRLRVRCDDHRPVPGLISVGPLPADQGGREAPYAARPAGQHPDRS